MTLEGLKSKTIRSAQFMKHYKHDDEGYLCLFFTDGTKCLITAGYGGYTGESEDEYPTNIGISDREGCFEELVPLDE